MLLVIGLFPVQPENKITMGKNSAAMFLFNFMLLTRPPQLRWKKQQQYPYYQEKQRYCQQKLPRSENIFSISLKRLWSQAKDCHSNLREGDYNYDESKLKMIYYELLTATFSVSLLGVFCCLLEMKARTFHPCAFLESQKQYSGPFERFL